MKKKSNNRYFVIYFTGITPDGERTKGKMHIVLEDGSHYNERAVQEDIIEIMGLKEPFISGDKELSEEDFMDLVEGLAESAEDKPENDDYFNEEDLT